VSKEPLRSRGSPRFDLGLSNADMLSVDTPALLAFQTLYLKSHARLCDASCTFCALSSVPMISQNFAWRLQYGMFG
jgi:hypothetical protein